MFAMTRLVVTDEATPEERAVQMLQEHVRMHTQVVRNWGYHDTVKRTLRELYSTVNDEYKQAVGFTPQNLVSFFNHLVDETERRVNDHRRRLMPAMRGKTTESAVRRFYAENTHLGDSAEDMLALAKKNRFSREQVCALLWAYCDFYLSECFRFKIENVSKAVGIPAGEASEIVNKLSKRLGSLADHDRNHLFLGNPVWEKPLIEAPDGEFFCPNPQSFFHFSKTIIEGLAKNNVGLKEKVEKQRADYLETAIVKLFAAHFPASSVKRGFKWMSGNVEYESDVVMLVDSHLVIIEAKSGRVSPPALRGAPQSAKDHVDALFIEPSVQSARLAERLREALRDPEARDELSRDLQMDLRTVYTVLRLSVTLDDFATLQTNLELLREAGWLPADHKVAPCMLITDLDAVFEILAGQAQKLHYLRRRSELDDTLVTTGDELDLLGLYLKTSLIIAEAEPDRPYLHLIGMSKEIDLYQEARIHGIERKKPQMRLSPWWRQLLEAVEKRAFPRWTDVCLTLLNVPPEEQKKAETMMARVKQNVKRMRRTPKPPSEPQDSLFVLPSPRNKAAIVFHAFNLDNAHERHANMQSLAAQAFDNTDHLDRCLVIAFNVSGATGPYSTLGMFYRSETQPNQLDDLQVY